MKRYFLTIATSALLCTAFAQNDNAVLLKVGKESITKNEFIQAYQKNNLLSESTEKDLREYLDLFINYRMKVQEAQSLQMDTAQAFQKELSAYKSQSAQQYMVDTEVSDRLLEEAFEHSKYHVRASHILIRCADNASPKDTLAAYRKIQNIRDMIVNGLDFNEAAFRYSEDESAKGMTNPQTGRFIPGNRGELGYFSVMEMIYPFEVAAYNTPVGQVSMPFRTQFGYHLVYVQEKVPAINKVFVSQIFIADTAALTNEINPAIKSKNDLIKSEYKNGISFADLAVKYSDDKANQNEAGVMAPFSPNRRPGNYVSAAIHLKNGEISEAVPTNIGWHILKLDSIQYATANEETKYLLKNKLARDSRSKKSKDVLIEKLKKEYNFEESGKKAAMKFFAKNLPASYFQSTAISIDSLKGIKKLKPMFTFANEKYTALDFGTFISRYQGTQLKGTVEQFLNSIYPNFVNERILRYERQNLENKYPEYRELITEFHDGMLLYEINSEKVWNAAIKDTIGLEKFYETIKTQYPVDTPNDTIQYKPMSEIRAIVVSKYQDYLEQEWIKALRAKYDVKVNEDVFATILKK